MYSQCAHKQTIMHSRHNSSLSYKTPLSNNSIGPVIYFALRIRITGLTQVELVQQLEDQAAVELQAGAPKYKEVDDEDKTPLAIAVAVDDKSIV